MGLLVYKFSEYNHTAEREQFRKLCKSLQAYYGTKEEVCIFIGNFNVNNVELDGFIVKPDAIVNVEFKNYGGKIIAADNGEWMLANGVIIKGGSGKSVYQQAFLNRTQTQKGLKQVGHLTNKQVKNLASLVVFNQPIEAMDTSRLLPATKLWLHIADNTSFIEKVQDITNADFHLEHSDILSLLKLLYLDRRYLVEEYSNVEMLDEDYCPSPIAVDFRPDSEEVKETTKQRYTPQKEIKVVGHIDLDASDDKLTKPQELVEENKSNEDACKEAISVNSDDKNANSRGLSSQSIPTIDKDTQSEIESLTAFIRKAFKQICKDKTFTIHTYRYNDPNLLTTFPYLLPKRQWFILVQIEGAQALVEKVTKFMYRDVQCTSNYLMFEVGLPIEEKKTQTVDEGTDISDKEAVVVHDKLKSHTALPSWLDRMLFEKLGAKYNPDYQRHSYNLDLTEDEVLNYLGTYFPRSYAEAFCIYDNICSNSVYVETLVEKKEVHILDVGCGTGGELVGLISVLEKKLPYDVNFKIDAVDGNEFSLNKFKEIVSYITKKTHRKYEINTRKNIFACTDDIESLVESYSGESFDIIQMCKFGCELESRKVCKMANPYQLLLTHFSKLLSQEGLFLMLDVTTLSHRDGMFYPQLLNMGIRDSLRKQPALGVLLPTCCQMFDEQCLLPCFTQKEFSIRHSMKIGDISKVAYRIIAHKEFIKSLGIDTTSYNYLVRPHDGMILDDCTCRYSNSSEHIYDAYKLRNI